MCRRTRHASPAISCRNIGMRFFTERRDVTAIKSLDLDVAQGEFLTLLGPSGCGKSTFLRVVADLLEPSRGKIDVLSHAPQAARKSRDIGFVFQDAALLPWRTALQNVELPLQVGGGAQPQGPALASGTARAGRPEGPRERAARTRCPAACASACRSRGRWSATRRSC